MSSQDTVEDLQFNINPREAAAATEYSSESVQLDPHVLQSVPEHDEGSQNDQEDKTGLHQDRGYLAHLKDCLKNSVTCISNAITYLEELKGELEGLRDELDKPKQSSKRSLEEASIWEWKEKGDEGTQVGDATGHERKRVRTHAQM